MLYGIAIGTSLLTTTYYESFEAEKSRSFCNFLHFRETFLYENSRWCCSNTELRESMWDSAKVFS